MKTIDYKKLFQEKAASQGQQSKGRVGNYWVKLDGIGGPDEALSEVIVTAILDMSNIPSFMYVKQSFALVEEQKDSGKNMYRACISEDMRQNPISEEIITFQQAAQKELNIDLSKNVHNITLETGYTKDKYAPIQYVLDVMSKIGLKSEDVGSYLTSVIELDALSGNTDRHWGNLALIYDGEQYRLSPIFDNGAALFSHYTYDWNFEHVFSTAESRPFYTRDTQKELLEEHFGKCFATTFSCKELANVLDEAAVLYPDNVLRKTEEFTIKLLDIYRGDIVLSRLPNEMLVKKDVLEKRRLAEFLTTKYTEMTKKVENQLFSSQKAIRDSIEFSIIKNGKDNI